MKKLTTTRTYLKLSQETWVLQTFSYSGCWCCWWQSSSPPSFFLLAHLLPLEYQHQMRVKKSRRLSWEEEEGDLFSSICSCRHSIDCLTRGMSCTSSSSRTTGVCGDEAQFCDFRLQLHVSLSRHTTKFRRIQFAFSFSSGFFKAIYTQSIWFCSKETWFLR